MLNVETVTDSWQAARFGDTSEPTEELPSRLLQQGFPIASRKQLKKTTCLIVFVCVHSFVQYPFFSTLCDLREAREAALFKHHKCLTCKKAALDFDLISDKPRIVYTAAPICTRNYCRKLLVILLPMFFLLWCPALSSLPKHETTQVECEAKWCWWSCRDDRWHKDEQSWNKTWRLESTWMCRLSDRFTGTSDGTHVRRC